MSSRPLLVSFATIGAAWIPPHAHHRVPRPRRRHVPAPLNLLLLPGDLVPAVPDPPSSPSTSPRRRGAGRGRSSTGSRCCELTLIALLWRYAARAGLIRPDADNLEVRLLVRRLTPGGAGYVVLILLGLWRPTVAVVGYLLIAIFFLIPFPIRFGRGASRSGEAK